MEVVYKFMLWFIAVLISVFLLESIVSNPFTKAFILTLIIATLIVKDSK